jgi:hypothetical protein
MVICDNKNLEKIINQYFRNRKSVPSARYTFSKDRNQFIEIEAFRGEGCTSIVDLEEISRRYRVGTSLIGHVRTRYRDKYSKVYDEHFSRSIYT